MVDSRQLQMGRPMLVPPWAADLDPNREAYTSSDYLVVETRGIARACIALPLLCCSPRGRLPAMLAYDLLAWPAWGNSKYAVLR